MGVSFLREMAVDSPPFYRKEHPFKSFSRGGFAALGARAVQSNYQLS